MCRPLHDDRVVAHRSADEALLARKRWRRAFPDHDEGFLVVLLTPRKVVMVVHQVQLTATEERNHLARHPFASGVRVLTGKRHQLPVIVSHRLAEREQHLALWDTLPPFCALRKGQKARRNRVAEPAAAKMHSNPDCIRLVNEDIDVMVTTANRAELRPRFVAKRFPYVRRQSFPRC